MTSRSLSRLLLCCGALVSLASATAQTLENGQFRLRFANGGIASLERPGDRARTEYIAPRSALGSLVVRYRMGSGAVREFSTTGPANRRSEPRPADAREHVVVYNESGWNDYFADLEVTGRFRLEGDALYWTVHLRNLTHKPLEIGDVLLPAAIDHTMERFMVGSHEWYPYWTLSDTRAPYLLMMPVTECPLFEPSANERNFEQARFEHFDGAGLYLHSAFTAPGQFSSSMTLAPKFSPRDEITWVFKLRWVAPGVPALQKALSAEGLLSDANGIPE